MTTTPKTPETPERIEAPKAPRKKYESPFLTSAQAAEYLQVSKVYLQRLRTTGEGPTFLRVSQRRILYSLQDLESWVASVRRQSTVDSGSNSGRH